MANEIDGKSIGLYYNQGTPEVPDWVLAVCSTTDGFSASIDAVTTSTKCDEGWVSSLPGDASWSFSHSALASSAPATGQISFKEVEDIFLSKEVGQWKLESVNPADNFYWIGMGWISSLDETAAAGEYLTVDITITGTGEPVNVAST